MTLEPAALTDRRFVAVSAGVSNRRVEGAPTVRFATVARRLGAAARAAGLTVPAFRTPPRRPGAPRTIRRLPGGPVVAVALKGRVFAEVVHDMVDGVIAANHLEGEAAGRVRGVVTPRAHRAGLLGRRLAWVGTPRSAPGWRNRQTQAA